MINVNDFKPGITFEFDGEIFVVINAQHSKQGRGQANVKAKIKNLRTGSIITKTFTGGEKVQPAFIDRKIMTFLYKSADKVFLMDKETFEQLEMDISKIKWELNFLKENEEIKLRTFKGEILDLELPAEITLEVVEAPGAEKGNSTTNPQKKVKIETGYELDVPVFINVGDKIVISTETGKYKKKG